MDISGRYTVSGTSWLHTFEDFWVLNGSALRITPLFLFGGNSRGDEIGQEEAAQRNEAPHPCCPTTHFNHQPVATTHPHRLDSSANKQRPHHHFSRVSSLAASTYPHLHSSLYNHDRSARLQLNPLILGDNNVSIMSQT